MATETREEERHRLRVSRSTPIKPLRLPVHMMAWVICVDTAIRKSFN